MPFAKRTLQGRRPRMGSVVRAALESLEGRRLLSGTGLTGQYYADTTLATLKLTRTDATVNFNWGTSSPDPSIAANNFSARWTGQVQAQYSELYTFTVSSDDGCRLWVNDQLILNNWTNQSATPWSGQIALVAGQKYDLKLEYYDSTGNASVQLEWSSASTALQVVPQSQLYPTQPVDDRGSILEETWLNVAGSAVSNLTSSANYPAKADFRQYLTSFESTVQNWGDNYGSRIQGYVVPPVSGTYTFAISGDDATELWLSTDANAANATRIAYSTSPTGFRQFNLYATQQSAPVTLVGGQQYYIEAFHKENTGSDHFSVAWATPQNPTLTVIDGTSLVPYGIGGAIPAPGYLATMTTDAHPRIDATPDAFAKALGLYQGGGSFTTWYKNLKSTANGVLTKYANVASALADPGATGQTQTPLADLQGDLTALAGAYRMALMAEGSSVANPYADKAIAIMKQAVTWQSWDGGNQALGIGMAAQGFALCYDWMYSYISSTDRATIAAGLDRLAIKPVLATVSAGNYWAGWKNNWTYVCLGGPVAAGLAIAPDYYTADTEALISKMQGALKATTAQFLGDNGGTNEGPGYSAYGTLDLLLMLGAMETTLGTDFGISEMPGLSLYPNFVMGQTSPVVGETYWFNDGAWSQNGDPVNFWLAKRFGRTDVAWQVRQRIYSSPSVFAFLDWDGRGSTPGATDGATNFGYYGDPNAAPHKSEDVYTSVDSWANPQASFMFKGGYKGDNDHEQLDAGSFIYDAMGLRWAQDLGRDSYSLPRWETYRNRAEGQNTLVINPSTSTAVDAQGSGDRVDQMNDSSAYSHVIRDVTTADETIGVVDLTPAYSGMGMGAGAKVLRGFRFNRWDDSLMVQDEITAANPSEVYWFMHYRAAYATAAVSPDGKSATITWGPKRLWLTILSGTNATFTIMDAAPLPSSPNAAGQADNSGYKKLAIHMNGVTSDRLTVWMVPLQSGQAIPTAMPPVTPTMSWTPSTPKQVFVGDIDGYVNNGATDTPPLDPTWKAQVQALTTDAIAGLDAGTGAQAVPMTFNVPLAAGETITRAKLTFGLKSTGGSTASDMLYLGSVNNGKTYAQLGWAAVDTTATAREIDVSNLVGAMQAGKFSIAFVGNTEVDWASLTLDTTTQAGISYTVTLNPLTDAFVQDGASASLNYGGASTLVAQQGTPNLESYLQYDLSGLTGAVRGVTTQLTPLSVSGSVPDAAGFVASNAWTESGITWNTKPPSTSALATWTPVTGTASSFDATSMAAGALAADNKLSLRVWATATGGSATYASRSYSSAPARPQMVVTLFDAAPTVSNIADQTTPQGTSVTVPFTIGDSESGPGGLTLSASSSNSALLPAGSITFAGSGASRTVTLAPAAGQAGSATVTITVADPQGAATTDTFVLHVPGITTINGDQSAANQNDSFLLVRSGNFANVYLNGGATPVLSQDVTTTPDAIAINGLGGNDTLTVDYSGGDPVPANGVSFDGGGQASDAIIIKGSAGNDAVALASGQVQAGAVPVNYSNVAVMSLNLGGGIDTVSVPSASVAPAGGLMISAAGGGTVQLAAGTALPSTTDISVGSGTMLDLNGLSPAIDQLIGSGAVSNSASGTAATLTVGSSGAGFTWAGSIQDGAGLVGLKKVGTGTITLAGSNSYSGQTALIAGTLAAGSPAGISSRSQLSMAAGTTLDLHGFNSAIYQFFNNSAGTVTDSAAGTTAVLTVGVTNVTAGDVNFAGSIQDGAGAVGLTINAGNATRNLLRLTGTGNTYSGPTTVNGPSGKGYAALAAGAANSWSPNSAVTVFSGSYIDINGYDEQIGSLSGSGMVQNYATTTTQLNTLSMGSDNTSTSFGGVLHDVHGALAVRKTGSGTLTLTGSNANSGGFTVAGGTLLAATTASLPGYATPGKIAVAGGATMALSAGGTGQWAATDLDAALNNATFSTGAAIGINVDAANVFTYGTNLTKAIGFAKLGPGTLTLSGVNTYTGATSVTGGKLIMVNSLTTSPALSVSSGAVAQAAAGGGRIFRLASLALSGTGRFDLADERLILTGTSGAALSGMLLSGRDGGDWNPTTSGGITSSVAAADPSRATAIGWAAAGDLGITTWGGTTLSATDLVAGYTFYGDVNLDGKVTADDYALMDRGLARKITSAARWVDGDVNYDGAVNASDSALLDATFGRQGGLPAPILAADPTIVPSSGPTLVASTDPGASTFTASAPAAPSSPPTDSADSPAALPALPTPETPAGAAEPVSPTQPAPAKTAAAPPRSGRGASRRGGAKKKPRVAAKKTPVPPVAGAIRSPVLPPMQQRLLPRLIERLFTVKRQPRRPGTH